MFELKAVPRGVGLASLLLLTCTHARPAGEKHDTSGWVTHQAPNPSPNGAYKWMEIALEATARDVERVGARPTIISREVSMYVTAMFDAWAAYDEKAVGTRLGGKLRRPAAERTLTNKEAAIGQAVGRVLIELYPNDLEWIRASMKANGADADDNTGDTSKPRGVGNTVAGALIAYRAHDGSNAHGDEKGGNGKPYSDYTGYLPVNPIDKIVDPDRWQPIPFDDGHGGTVWPGFLTAQWGKVKPVVLERADQFRPAPYPKVGSPELAKDVEQNIEFNAGLTLEQKAVVEFMRDGPRSTGQSGHWMRFAQDVSRRDHHDLDQDVKMFFAIGNVTFDAFIACWEAKRFYDSARPYALVRTLKKDQQIRGYLGSCKGVGAISAAAWTPYSPPTFLTPPFPGYPSGHSTASGAGSKMLELFTGSDRFESVAHRVAGEITEQCGCEQMQSVDGKPGPMGKKEIDLELPTFSATAEMAGISRVMGGYHINSDNTAGLKLGRDIAEYSWPKYQAYFNGTAPEPKD